MLSADQPAVRTLLERARLRASSESGLTLVELLVTMGILLTVLVAVTDVLISGTHSQTNVEHRLNTQSEARLALTKMRQDVHCAYAVQSVDYDSTNQGFTLSLTEFLQHLQGSRQQRLEQFEGAAPLVHRAGDRGQHVGLQPLSRQHDVQLEQHAHGHEHRRAGRRVADELARQLGRILERQHLARCRHLHDRLSADSSGRPGRQLGPDGQLRTVHTSSRTRSHFATPRDAARRAVARA